MVQRARWAGSVLGGKLGGGVGVMGMEKSLALRSRSRAMYLSLSFGEGKGGLVLVFGWEGFGVAKGDVLDLFTFDANWGRVSAGLHDAAEEDGDVSVGVGEE